MGPPPAARSHEQECAIPKPSADTLRVLEKALADALQAALRATTADEFARRPLRHMLTQLASRAEAHALKPAVTDAVEAALGEASRCGSHEAALLSLRNGPLIDALADEVWPEGAAKRLIKRGWQEHERNWVESAGAALPKEIRVCVPEAVVSLIGTAATNERNLQEQVSELKQGLERTRAHQASHIFAVTKCEKQLEGKQQSFARATKRFEEAKANLDRTLLETAASISTRLCNDRIAYNDAIRDMATNEVGVLEALTQRAEQIGNVGELAVGSNVLVVVANDLRRAQVIERLEGDRYKMSLWQEVYRYGEPYEEGYNTRTQAIEERPRAQIYASSAGKERQRLSRVAREAASSVQAASRMSPQDAGSARARTPRADASSRLDQLEDLLLLYADAERCLPRLRELAAVVERPPAVRAIVPPLKGVARATVKAYDKYSGDFSRLTDLARMTFECETLGDTLTVLESLSRIEGWSIVQVKNRLMLAFDADEHGGYRDLLLNMRCRESTHIVEVQLTLKRLLAIKAGGGHEAYVLARLLDLNEATMNRWDGAISARALSAIEYGMLRHLHCNGPANLSEHCEALPRALRSRACSLSSLVLSHCDWPAGHTLCDLFEGLGQLRGKLSFLVIKGLRGIGASEIPAVFFERCEALRLVTITQLGASLTGTLPATVGRLKRVETFSVWGNQLHGEVPVELSECTALRVLILSTNAFCGEIPNLKRCVHLHYLHLSNNHFAGNVPQFTVTAPVLKFLNLAHNEFTGEVPAALLRRARRDTPKPLTLHLAGNLGLYLSLATSDDLLQIECLPEKPCDVCVQIGQVGC